MIILLEDEWRCRRQIFQFPFQHLIYYKERKKEETCLRGEEGNSGPVVGILSDWLLKCKTETERPVTSPLPGVEPLPVTSRRSLRAWCHGVTGWRGVWSATQTWHHASHGPAPPRTTAWLSLEINASFVVCRTDNHSESPQPAQSRLVTIAVEQWSTLALLLLTSPEHRHTPQSCNNNKYYGSNYYKHSVSQEGIF